MTDSPRREWLERLPKVELHVHLEGSLSPTTVTHLSERHEVDTTEIWPDGIPEAFSFVDFPDFARQYIFGLGLIRTGEDLVDVVVGLGEDLLGHGVRYAEATTTAYTHLTGALSPADYRAALDEGRRRVSAMGVELGWVIDIPRDLETPESTTTTDLLAGPDAPAGTVAIGLGGYEVPFPAGWFAEQFGRAKALGLASVPHAGETVGPESVRSALDDLGADRLGHGVRSIEDGALVAELAERRVMLEVCPTSNLLLGVVDDLTAHPLRPLLDAGVNVCVNTDDPGWFATDLTNELVVASEHLAVTPAEHVAMQRAAVDASFMPDALRSELRAELDAVALP